MKLLKVFTCLIFAFYNNIATSEVSEASSKKESRDTSILEATSTSSNYATPSTPLATTPAIEIGKPTKVKVDKRGIDFLVISWMPPQGSETQRLESTYTIKWNKTSQPNIKDTAYNITKLSQCSNYCVTISTHLKDKGSDFTEPICTSTVAPRPGTPQLNLINNSYSNSRSISWTYPGEDKCGVTFTVEYGLKDGSDNRAINNIGSRSTTLKGLVLSRHYRARVRAQSLIDTENGVKESDYSNYTEFATDIKPEIPSGVSINKRGKDFLYITWSTQSTKIQVSYKVKVNGDVRYSGQNDQYVNITNLLSCTNYCIEISANSKIETSAYTAPKCANTTAPSLGTPQLNRINNAYKTNRSISWTYPGDIKCGVKFTVEYRSKDGSDTRTINNIESGSTTLTDLVLSRHYRVRVRAQSLIDTENGVKESDYSDYTEFATDINPDAPTNIVLGLRGKDFLEFTWESKSVNMSHGPIKYYEIQLNDKPNMNASDSKVKIPHLTHCTNYCIKISAHSEFGNSGLTQPKCDSTTAPNVVMPQVNQVDNVYSNRRDISWVYSGEDKCGVTFTVEYGLKDGSNTRTIDDRRDRGTTLTDLGLSRYYRVRVRAQSLIDTENGVKQSDYSNYEYFETDIKPGTPSNVAVKSDRTSALVSWTSPSENISHGPISHYNVIFNNTSPSKALNKSYTFTDMQTCTMYCYTVSAISDFGQSDSSPSICQSTLTAKLREVKLIQVNDSYSSQRKLNWDYGVYERCEIKFYIEYEIKDNKQSTLNITTGDYSYTLTGLSLGQEYAWRVKARSPIANEESEFSEYSYFKTDRKPMTPLGLTVVYRDMNSLKISWESNREGADYSISNYSVRINNKVQVSSSKCTYTIQNLEPCREYCIEVSARNRFWSSEFTKPICKNTTGPNLGILKLNPLAPIYGQSRNVSWTFDTVSRCKVHFIFSYRDKYGGKEWILEDTSNHHILLEKLNLSRKYEVKIDVEPKYTPTNLVKKINTTIADFFTGTETPVVSASKPQYNYDNHHLIISWTEDSTITQNIIEYVIVLTNKTKHCLKKTRIICEEVNNIKNDNEKCDFMKVEKCSLLSIKAAGHKQFTTNVKTGVTNYSIVIYAINYNGKSIIYEEKEATIPEQKSGPMAFIIILIFFLIVVLFCIIGIIILKKRNLQKKPRVRRAPSMEFKQIRNSTADQNQTEVKSSLPEILSKLTGTRQNIHKFNAYCEKMRLNENESLIQEYKKLSRASDDLEKSLHLTKFIGKSPFNLKKNRFQNILPFDQNRVLLAGKVTNDSYINANFVPYSEDPTKVEFIASQGPIETTINAFVQMIWEQKVNCIVMLTQTYEDGKFKCMQYWPDNVGLKIQFGAQKEFTIQLNFEKEEISHFERKFILTNTRSNETRDVYHLHMHNWVDYSAPDPEHFYSALTRFHELMETTTSAPFLIHCSAGVGRTGTFICLDRIVRQLNKGAQYVDIYKTVLELRASRNFLVQRQAQYIFIHDFLDFFIRKFTSAKTSPTGDII